MSDFATTWKLNFVAEVKKFIKDTKDIVNGVGAVEGKIKRTEKQIKESLSGAENNFKDLEKEIKKSEAALLKLQQRAAKAPPSEQEGYARSLEIQRKRLEKLRAKYDESKKTVKSFNDELGNLTKAKTNWTELATRINQTSEVLSKISGSFDFAVQTKKLTTNVQRMTDLSGDALDGFVKKSREIATVYDQDANQVAIAANAMTKQIGGSYQENLALIEQGMKRGANINGDFLASLSEYAPKIKEAGLTTEQAVALMAQAGKKGIYSDKAIDSIKEATQSLREMQQPQKDALAGIGLKPEDIEGKTAFDAIKMISEKMKGATTQAKQLILADIFKGAGEDAGQQLAEEFATMSVDINSLPVVEETASGFKTLFSNIQTWAGQAFGGFATYAQQMSPIVQTVAGAIPIMQSLTKVTWLQNFATKALAISQKALNLVLGNNPIGWVVRILGLLVTGVMLAWDKFEGFRKAMFRVGAWAKNFGSIIKEYLIDRVKGLISGISGLGKTIGLLFSGKWKEAAATGKQAFNDLVGLDAATKAVAKATDKERNQAVMDEADKRHAAYEEGRKKEKEQEEGINGLLEPQQAEVLSFSPDDKTKNGKGKTDKEGLNVGSGSGGLRSINMTLNVTNQFSVSKDTNLRDIADKIVGMVNDRMRDSVINMGV